ncbi:hypothetical protein [Natranaeroarchaeum aerophilus]|uniref:Uncharacterized protein n=1 Tax=Natranaeroarchaeum aerophilus TaxID=2917711 RepID=A0AAE3FSX2_9EURY|nr:hypothetical protein [Natranaeroarchaeum aerophilus]MCL9814719.1 hypothetical protein [Natranaeroarchaeum aerophilus]
MNRRTYMVAAGSIASALFAGCIDELDNGGDTDTSNTDNGDDTGDGNGTNDTADNDTRDSDPIDAVEAYVRAGENADIDATIEAVHEESPLLPFLEEGETDFDEIDDVEIVDHETIKKDVTAADVLDLQYAETLFQDEDELANALDGEAAVLLDVTFDPEDSFREDTWVVVTEGEEWKMFWATAEPPETPAEQLDPEIIDEDDAVVADIDWDPDIDNPGEWARVTLVDEPGIEADAVRIESTIADSEFEFSGESQTAWSGSWANVNLNEEGDQIVVTAITDNEETVVHRVHYEP